VLAKVACEGKACRQTLLLLLLLLLLPLRQPHTTGN
jgi:hypothetical protein